MAIVGFDGTWNDERPTDPKQRPSNVVRFVNACDPRNVAYQRGIGNKTDYGIFTHWMGGAFGLGGKDIVLKALFSFGDMIETGAERILDAVGFSRGAALALHFANTVSQRGVPFPSTRKKRVKWVRNPGGKGTHRTTIYEYEWAPVKVRWVGLWDTVPAMGVPDNNINLGYQLGVPRGVSVSHAMALNVSSSNFILRRESDAREVWFMGHHGEVGGSSGDQLKSDCALAWMVREAVRCGVPVNPACVAMPTSGSITAPKQPARKVRMRGRRIVRAGDSVHESVIKEAYSNVPWEKVTVVK